MNQNILSNIDSTAVAVWGATIALFVLLGFLRSYFKLNFSVLTILALVLGVALSLVFNGKVESLNLLGTIYISLITAFVAPLIFVSIISSITYVGSLKKLRSIGFRSVGWLMLTNAIAIATTLAVAVPLRIGAGVHLVDDETTAGFLTSQTAPLDQVIVNFFPKNVIGDLSGNRVVPIIITATVLAVAIVSVSKTKDVSVFRRFFEQGRDIIYKAVGYVVELTPYAVVVLGATSTSATTSKSDALLALVSLLVLGFVLNFFQAYVVNGLLLKFVARISPIGFFKALLPAQTTAFTTQSSVATLPLSIRQVGTIGVRPDVANFTTPLGTTIGMPGCAGVWPMLSAVFTINAVGLHYSSLNYVVLALVGLFASIGTAGVPGTAIVTATTVFTAVGLPVQLLVPLVPVSNIVGMPSTMANVSAAVTSSVLVAKQTGEFDEQLLAHGAKEGLAPSVAGRARAVSFARHGRASTRQPSPAAGGIAGSNAIHHPADATASGTLPTRGQAAPARAGQTAVAASHAAHSFSIASLTSSGNLIGAHPGSSGADAADVQGREGDDDAPVPIGACSV